MDFFDDRIFEAGAVQSYVMLPAVGCGVCTYLSAVLSRSSCLCISRWCGVATFPCLPTALMTSAVRLSKFVHKAVGACLLPALRCRLKSLLLHLLCSFVLFCIMDYDPASWRRELFSKSISAVELTFFIGVFVNNQKGRCFSERCMIEKLGDDCESEYVNFWSLVS